MTPTQITGWNTLAKTIQTTPRLGQSGPMTGLQLFIRTNMNLDDVGQSTISDPPTIPALVALPDTAMTVTNTAGVIKVTFSIAGSWNNYTTVSACPPVSAGISVCNNWRFCGVMPLPASGVSDVTSLLTNKLGTLVPGQKLFIQVGQIINGFADIPQQFEALIPAAS